ncbi:MAG: hypothetical protein AAF127_12420 [Pseudomonadota bacterium]
MAWVLAGSSLGNRSILAEVRRTASDNCEAGWPARFLSDAAMLAFWKDLRAQIERPASCAEARAASEAATAVFDHFLAIAARPPSTSPAPNAPLLHITEPSLA